MKTIYVGDRWVAVPRHACDLIGDAYLRMHQARASLLAAESCLPGGTDGMLAAHAVNEIHNLLGDAIEEIDEMSDDFREWVG